MESVCEINKRIFAENEFSQKFRYFCFHKVKHMFQKLRTIIYHAPDLAQTKEWYATITGIQPYFDQPFYVGFDIHGYELGLDPNSEKPTGPGNVAYWKVENIKEAVAKCTATGATIYSDINNVGGTIEVAIVIDPFGNHVGLIQE